MTKTTFIFQPHFIGDLLFCQGIANRYSSFGHKVIWPVAEKYRWVIDDHLYTKGFNYDKISFPTYGTNFEYSELFNRLAIESRTIDDKKWKQKYDYNSYFSFLPLEPSWLHRPDLPLMSGKYTMSDLKALGWQDWVPLKRNYQREDALMEHLGLNEYSKYVLINPHCSTKSVNITITEFPEEYKAIEMKTIEGYNLFDWLRVIEYANAIVTIDTVLVLLCEILKIKDKPMHVLNRYTEKDPNLTSVAIGDIVNCPWIFHDDITDNFVLNKI